jgi:hypothetical protein
MHMLQDAFVIKIVQNFLLVIKVLSLSGCFGYALFIFALKVHSSLSISVFFFGEISQKIDFVRPEADILSQIPRFSVDEFAKEDEKYG